MDAAVVVTFLAAAINVVIGVLVVDEVGRSAAAVPTTAVAAIVVISVAYAGAVLAAVLLFRAGRSWARAAFFALSALSLFTILALNLLNLAVIVLLVVADVLLYRPSVSVWVRSLRGV